MSRLWEGGPEEKPRRESVQAAFAHLAERYDLWYRTPLRELVDAHEREAVFSLVRVRTGEVALESLGPRFLKPFGAFIAARVEKAR